MRKLLIIMLICGFVSSGLVLPKQKIYKMKTTTQLNIKFKLRLTEISKSIRNNKKLDPVTLNKWKQLVKDLYSSDPSTDINSLVQSVLKESYDEMQDDLALYASKVKYFNKLKKQIREQINELRDHRSQLQSKPGLKIRRKTVLRFRIKNFSNAIKFSKRVLKIQKLSKPDRSILLSGRIHVNSEMVDFKNKTEFDEYIGDLEEDLAAMGEEADLANIDLQNALQKLQQVIQQLSNVSKVLNDTALAAIRKLG